MPNVEGSNPFARFSLGNGRLCLPSLTRSGLSAFAARSQRRGSANRNGDPDFAELSSNPFARFVCNAREFSEEPRTYAPNPRVLRGAAPNESLYFGTDFERFACANCPNIVFTSPRISHLFASVGSSFISGALIRPSRALDQALIR